MGLRDISTHCRAAYISSFTSCAELCKTIDINFDPFDAAGHCGLADAVQSFNALVSPEKAIALSGERMRQADLSKALEEHSKASLLRDWSNSVVQRAHIKLCAAEGAGAWGGW